MVFSKALFLKGLAGAATVGTVALGLGFKEQIFGKKEVKEDDLGIPTSCTETCELTKEQFEKIKFQEKSGSTVTFEGLNADDKVTLTVTDKTSDTANYPKGKSYKFKTSSNQKTVTIKGMGDNDITITNTGVGVDFRETTGGGKLEKAPEAAATKQQTTSEEVDTLGIPTSCKADQATGTTTQTCELTKEQFEKIKFQEKTGSKITFEGLSETDKITLTIEDKTSDKTNYPKGKSYKFKTASSQKTVTIKGSGDSDISITNTGEGVDFRETTGGGKLEKVTVVQQSQDATTENELGIPTSCTQTCDLTKEQLKNIKFETRNNSSIEIEGLDGTNDKVTLTITDVENDTTNYPKKKKYTFTNKSSSEVKIKNAKDNDIVLTSNQDVNFRETSTGDKLETTLDTLGIPKACTETCQLTKDQLEKIKFETKDSNTSTVSIEGLETNDKITLKIEEKSGDSTNYPKGKKYTLTSTKDGDVKIKNTKDGDISLTKDKEIDFRETTEGGKLETAEDALGIPKGCTKTCDLTKEQFEKIKFEPKDSSSIEIEGLDGNNTVELTITDMSSNQTSYPKGKKYSFKAKNDGIKIKNAKTGDIDISKDKGVDFKETSTGGKLEKDTASS